MTKLESAELLIKQQGDCEEPKPIRCVDCFLSDKCNKTTISDEQVYNYAVKYIKKEH